MRSVFFFDADPQVTRQDRAIRADRDFAILWFVRFHLVVCGEHTGVDETQVWVAPIFMTVVVDRFVDFGRESGFRVIVEPEHASVHTISAFPT